MPRFFFHVDDCDAFTDHQGTELPDLDTAKREAVRFVAALLRDEADRFWEAGDWRMRVTNEADLPILDLTLSGTQVAVADEGGRG